MGPCVFTHNYTIDNVVLFDLSVDTTGTTCNLNEGAATLTITTGGTGPYQFEIDGQSTIISDLSYTFTDLSSGNYNATVTDDNGCAQVLPFTINDSGSVDFVLVGSDSTNGTNGSISTFITSGEPPFILTWSSNVGGQTGLTVSNLSAGTYSLTVIDSNECTQIRTIVINGFNVLSSYQTFNICDDDFMNTGQTTRKGPQQMLIEGFNDLTSGDTNCLLEQTVFTAEVTVSGDTQTQSFYTGTTLSEFPLDSEFYDVVKEMLLSYDGVGEVLLDYLENRITVNTDCSSSVSLIDTDIKISLKISYDIDCQSCGPVITPTPTSTPAATPVPIPVCNCYYGDVTISDLDIQESDDLAVYVMYKDCDGTCYCLGSGTGEGVRYSFAGTYLEDICIDTSPTGIGWDLYIYVGGIPQVLSSPGPSYVVTSACCDPMIILP
jgi:hypothetical protein